MQKFTNSLLFAFILLGMVSCDQETKKANGAPIVLGDPSTIVNESDTLFLRDNVAAMTVAAAPTEDTTTAAPAAVAAPTPAPAAKPSPVAKAAAPAPKPIIKKQTPRAARHHRAAVRKKAVAKKAVKKPAAKKATKRRRR